MKVLVPINSSVDASARIGSNFYETAKKICNAGSASLDSGSVLYEGVVVSTMALSVHE